MLENNKRLLDKLQDFIIFVTLLISYTALL